MVGRPPPIINLEDEHVPAGGSGAVVQKTLAGHVVLAVEPDDLDQGGGPVLLVGHDDADRDGALHVGVGGVVGDELEGA